MDKATHTLNIAKNLLGLRNQLYTEVCILKFFKMEIGGHAPLLFGLLLLGEHFRINFTKTILPFDICSGVSVGHVSESSVQKYWLQGEENRKWLCLN